MATDPPTALYNRPETIQYFNRLTELADAGVIQIAPERDIKAIDEMIFSGNLAFWTSLSSTGWPPDGINTFYEETPILDYELGIVPLPAAPDATEPVGNNLRYAHFISSSSPYPDVCWDWFAFLAVQGVTHGGIPARKSLTPAWEDEVGTGFAEAYLYAVSKNESLVKAPYNALTDPLEYWWYETVQSILRDSENPETVLTEAQRKADLYLQCAGGLDTAALPYTEIERQVSACARSADPDW
jgi:hypothetical protein